VLALTPSTGQQHETGLVHREPRWSPWEEKRSCAEG
jgi:hypothetical protein